LEPRIRQKPFLPVLAQLARPPARPYAVIARRPARPCMCHALARARSRSLLQRHCARKPLAHRLADPFPSSKSLKLRASACLLTRTHRDDARAAAACAQRSHQSFAVRQREFCSRFCRGWHERPAFSQVPTGWVPATCQWWGNARPRASPPSPPSPPRRCRLLAM
jgi:hypothetical protein